MKYLSHIAAIAALALLVNVSACAPAQPNYVPPQNLTLQTGASIAGSMTIDPSRFVPNTKLILSAVDNQPTMIANDDWETPTLVTPGSHILTVFICKCSALGGDALSGDVTLVATVKPGGTYTIRTTNPTGFTGFERHFVTVWIEDGNGASITPKAKFELDKGNPPIVQLFEH